MVDISRLVSVSYEQFGNIMDNITQDLLHFQKARNVQFDAIVAMLRSGSIPATHIACHLEVKNYIPVYFAYVDGKVVKMHDTPLMKYKKKDIHTILIVDANTESGTTAKEVIKEIKDMYPTAHMYFASVWMDQSLNGLPGIEKLFVGQRTNESGKLSHEEARKKGYIDGIIVAPWEDLEVDYREINNSCYATC